MKKKELLSKISDSLSKDFSNESNVETLQKELLNHFNRENLICIIIYSIFLLLSLILFDKIDNLAFVSGTVFLILVIVFLGVTLLVDRLSIIYIYKDKNNGSTTNLKKFFNFYQIIDIINFVGVFLTVFLWIALFVVTPVDVSGSSMEYTFREGDKVIVWHIGYTPRVSDVVIIEANENYTFQEDTKFVIKRVIATGGDFVEFKGNKMYVNGTQLDRFVSFEYFSTMMTDFVKDGENVKYYVPNKTNDGYEGYVPEDFCIVLGDNVNHSMDSKYVGLIHKEDVIGRVIYRIYPFDQMGIA